MYLTFEQTKMIEQQKPVFRDLFKFDYEYELKNGDVPWNTHEMAGKIICDMARTNNDFLNLHNFCDITRYISAKMKHCKNPDAAKLFQNLYKYNILDYSATLYGKRIVDYCSSHGAAYTYAIYKEVEAHDDFEKDFFPIDTELFFRRGYKMRGCSLDENNNLVLYDPTKDPDYIDFSKMTDEEYDAYEASLFPDLKENNSNE